MKWYAYRYIFRFSKKSCLGLRILCRSLAFALLFIVTTFPNKSADFLCLYHDYIKFQPSTLQTWELQILSLEGNDRAWPGNVWFSTDFFIWHQTHGYDFLHLTHNNAWVVLIAVLRIFELAVRCYFSLLLVAFFAI